MIDLSSFLMTLCCVPIGGCVFLTFDLLRHGEFSVWGYWPDCLLFLLFNICLMGLIWCVILLLG